MAVAVRLVRAFTLHDCERAPSVAALAVPELLAREGAQPWALTGLAEWKCAVHRLVFGVRIYGLDNPFG